jgi:hypothetical protein
VDKTVGTRIPAKPFRSCDNIKIDVGDLDCKDAHWVELIQDHVRRRTLV